MKKPHIKLGHRAQRTGLWAESKYTNLNVFDPYETAVDKVYFDKYWKDIKRDEAETIIIAEELDHRFELPVSPKDVKRELLRVPREFIRGLQGVVLLGGNSKLIKTFNALFCYGMYAYNVVFIIPFPIRELKMRIRSLPAPHFRREFERRGARYTRDENGWVREFDMESLRRFYLGDVLIHELGHHVDRSNPKSSKQRERFASWFADEYGQ